MDKKAGDQTRAEVASLDQPPLFFGEKDYVERRSKQLRAEMQEHLETLQLRREQSKQQPANPVGAKLEKNPRRQAGFFRALDDDGRAALAGQGNTARSLQQRPH